MSEYEDELDGVSFEDVSARIQEAQTRRVDYIKSLDSEEIKENLEDALDSTDVVVEGAGLASARSAGEGILLTTVMRLRDAIESQLIWMEEKFPTPELEEAKEMVKETKKKAVTKTRKPKSVDDDEEL